MMHAKKTKILTSIFVLIAGLVALINMPLVGIMIFGAVLSQGILGPGRNKVGGVIMSRWKSINYIRGYAVPSNPKTPAQLAHRAKFKLIVQFMQQLMVSIIPQCWDRYYNTMSGFNAVVSTNWDDFSAADVPTVNTIMAKGTLENLSQFTAAYESGSGDISITWDDEVFGNGLATDLIGVIVADTGNNKVYYQGTLPAKTRASESATVTIPGSLDFSTLIVWYFTYRGEGVDYTQSNSEALVPSEV